MTQINREKIKETKINTTKRLSENLRKNEPEEDGEYVL